MKYTVILARPDYIADSGNPVDTYTDWAVARDTHEAIVQAQKRAFAFDNPEQDSGSADDYYPVAVFLGHLDALA